jgi:hypothetical protein
MFSQSLLPRKPSPNAAPLGWFRGRRADDFAAWLGENAVAMPGGTDAPAATPMAGLEIVAGPRQG